MEENYNRKKLASILVTVGISITLLGSVLTYVSHNKLFNFGKEKVEQPIVNKNVSITDTGIAESVNKLYDATVIVEVGNDAKLTGWGSGFVYKTDENYGYILTNHHVIEKATRIVVVNTKEEETNAELVGSDEYNDVAVVRVPLKSVLAVANIGKSTDMKLGDTVFAIGTPISLQYKFSVTRGIISGKDRMVQMSSTTTSMFQQVTDSWYINLLQIDASINSGNSGGPLANANGEVIGITNSKLSSSSMNSSSIENMGFAIPIEDAITLASAIETNGKVTRPSMGVSLGDLSRASIYNINLDASTTYGALLTNVEEGGAAAQAGLKAGDVIIKFGEYRIANYKYLKYYMYRYKVGDTVKVTYKRGSEEVTTTVTLK